jgi:signal transduction histidine kinase
MDHRPWRAISERHLDTLFGPVERGGRPAGAWGFVPLRAVGPGSVPLAVVLALVVLTSESWFGGLLSPLGLDVYGVRVDPLVLLYAGLVAYIVVTAGRRPGSAYVLSAVTLAVTWEATDALGYRLELVVVSIIVFAVGVLAVARRYDWIQAVAALVAGFVVLVGVQNAFRFNPAWQSISALVFTLVLAAAALVVGQSIRQRRRATGELVEVRQDAAEQRGQRQVLEERARIAREMHDVVAHHMSVIAVQASTAEFRHDGVTDPLRAEFRSIADSARESLSEMRRLLGVFRQDGQVRERSPQPGVEGIGDLAESAGRTGVDVSVSVPDDLPELPDTVSLTAYRIVQEALSNVVRHAAGASAKVELYLEDEWLVVLVMNDSPADGQDAAASEPGLGLAGMRERVALVGGEVLAERLGRSGFVVKAKLPLELGEPS